MAKKKIINVYLSFPFVGRTKKNIKTTKNYIEYEAEKYLKNLPDFPRNSIIRFWSLYDACAAKEETIYADNQKYVLPNHIKKSRGKKRIKYIIANINNTIAECNYFFTFDHNISLSCTYYFLGDAKLQKLYNNAYLISDIELKTYDLMHGHKNIHIFNFNTSYTAIQAFPEFIKLNRQQFIRYIRKVNPEKANN